MHTTELRNMGFGAALEGGFESPAFAGAMAEQEARAAAREKNKDRPWRFFLKKGEAAELVFLTDGNEFKMSKEHNIQINGKWGNIFTCRGVLNKPCPLCQSGDNPYNVGFFLVVDKRSFTIKNGPNQGQTRSNQVRIFAAKIGTLGSLAKLFGNKKVGLKGIEFEVSRVGEKSAAVGDMFLPLNGGNPMSEEEMAELAGADSFEDLVDFDWEDYMEVLPADKLRTVANGLSNATTEEDDVDL